MKEYGRILWWAVKFWWPLAVALYAVTWVPETLPESQKVIIVVVWWLLVGSYYYRKGRYM